MNLVRHPRAILGVLLALLWAPVTSHCLLERLQPFEFLSCCTHEAEQCADKEKDCESDACAVVEEGFYKVQDNGDLVPEPTLVPVPFLPDTLFASDLGPNLPASDPPDSRSPWQFVHRTALPVRAPSLLA